MSLSQINIFEQEVGIHTYFTLKRIGCFTFSKGISLKVLEVEEVGSCSESKKGKWNWDLPCPFTLLSPFLDHRYFKAHGRDHRPYCARQAVCRFSRYYSMKPSPVKATLAHRYASITARSTGMGGRGFLRASF